MVVDEESRFICPSCGDYQARITELEEHRADTTNKYHASCCGSRIVVAVLSGEMLALLEKYDLDPTVVWV